MSVSDKMGKKGRIKNGTHAGFFIRIQDHLQNTGGYLVLSWREAPPVGYDDWVENLTDLDQFLRESAWDIEWLE